MFSSPDCAFIKPREAGSVWVILLAKYEACFLNFVNLKMMEIRFRRREEGIWDEYQ